jgi:hypothetical protein
MYSTAASSPVDYYNGSNRSIQSPVDADTLNTLGLFSTPGSSFHAQAQAETELLVTPYLDEPYRAVRIAPRLGGARGGGRKIRMLTLRPDFPTALLLPMLPDLREREDPLVYFSRVHHHTH